MNKLRFSFFVILLTISTILFAQRTEEVTCSNCGGRGALLCNMCGGRRFFTHMVGFMWQNIPCGNCRAQGVITCNMCWGKGVITKIKPNPDCKNYNWNHNQGACALCWMNFSGTGGYVGGSGYSRGNSYGGSESSTGGNSTHSEGTYGNSSRKQCGSCEIPGNGNCRACKGMGHVSSSFSTDQMLCATCHGRKKCVYCNGTGWQ